jgi:hypothetical protein
LVKDTFSQSPEESRHSVLEHLAPRTEKCSFRVERAAEGDKISFVATGTVQEEECARRRARYKPMNEIQRRGSAHTVSLVGSVMAGTPPLKPARKLSIQGGRRTFVPNSFGDSSRFLCESVAMAMT